mgnify:CR=1 FL=1
MAKRRRRVLPPTTKNKTKRPKVLYDAMPAPNHMMQFHLRKLAATPRSYPLTKLLLADGPESGQPACPAFVDPKYGLQHWSEREAEVPPTWMDPEIFIRMVLTDPEAQRLADAQIARKDAVSSKALAARLEEIFRDSYVKYAHERFSAVKSLIARWFIGYRYCRSTDLERKAKRGANSGKVRG